ncbi:MarR family transcriptional regulator [Nonomuraea wenchangensis]|uniref:MarR family winged helix-turn-helix transcriptional regulator n=1 Tax=Nonomuraea wenchangensis TaxID=568860 RepID=UPI0034271A31
MASAFTRSTSNTKGLWQLANCLSRGWRASGVSSRNATGLVDTLEHNGLVRRVPDPKDRRSVLAEITPAGRAWMEAFRKPSQLAMRAMFQGFTPEELVVLRDLCLRLAANQHRLAEHLRRIGQQP